MRFLALLLTLACSHVLAQYDWADALEKSLLFYEAQRSGRLPADNRISWRHDSALDDPFPQGYYDAGDHVKFGFPLASTVTLLSWGALSWQAGYDQTGQTRYFKESLLWATDWMISCHTDKFVLWGQVGDGEADHAFWGRPEDMPMARPAYFIDANRPGTELAGETAAALAAASMVYRNLGDAAKTDEALSHARDLFEFADLYRADYTESMPEADAYYNSWNGYHDELAWSALWMHKATGEPIFLTKAEQFYDEFGLGYRPKLFNWDDKVCALQFLLYEATGQDRYLANVNAYLDYLLNDAPYTPKGMIYLEEWGSLRYAANVAFWCLQVAEAGIRPAECRQFAHAQMGYILGDTGRSFVIGLGQDWPLHAHHRSACCPAEGPCGWDTYNGTQPNANTLVGALVGGPDSQDVFSDSRQDWRETEVMLDSNAAYQGVLAAFVIETS